MRTSAASFAFMAFTSAALPALAQGPKPAGAAPSSSASLAAQIPVVPPSAAPPAVAPPPSASSSTAPLPSVPPPVAPTPLPPSEAGQSAPQQPIGSPSAAPQFPPPRWYPPPMYRFPPPPPQKSWYGWQTLIGLSISHTLAGVGGVMVAMEAPEFGVALIVTGSAGHLFTGPIVHWAHGHVARGFASLGITLGVPSSITAIVIATGLVMDSGCRGDFCGAGTIYIGFISGWIATVLAPAVDVAVLSYDELPAPGKDKPRPAAGFRPVVTGIVPLLGQGKTGLALAGQF